MISPLEVCKKTMTPEKAKSAKNDIFAFYVGRPITYVLTVPFLYTNLSPNAITLLSIIPLFVGFIVFYLSQTTGALIVGWCLYFLWALLDGVDGNVARYKKEFSELGSVYDAMSGYLAMVFTFFSMGIVASHFGGPIDSLIVFDKEIYIILGALSGVFTIFPRLVMHKALSTLKNSSNVDAVKDKGGYSVLKLVVFNISSITGIAEVLMLLALLFGYADVYTVFYFCLNLLIMLASLYSILKEK